MSSSFLNGAYANIGWIKLIAIFVVLAVCGLIVLKIVNIESIRGRRGVSGNMGSISALHKRDKNIIFLNKLVKLFGAIGRIPLISYDEISRDYMDYNLKRAGIKRPGGLGNIKADEFKGACVSAMVVLSVLFALCFPFVGITVSFVGIVATIAICSLIPQSVIRTMVFTKDAMLKEGFPDFYLMLHYVLLTGGKTPIDRVMKSYAKVTDNTEVLRFIDVSVDYIETYGEYTAMTYIAKDYREVAEVGKLCRMIKQMFEGADVTNELLGFRSELIQQKKWRIEQAGEKLIGRAKRSFNILMVVLVQAVISAMFIYIPDITSGMSVFTGG